MKLRLPNKLIAAIVAAASPVLFSTLSTATLGAAAVATLSQQAMGDWIDNDYLLDPTEKPAEGAWNVDLTDHDAVNLMEKGGTDASRKAQLGTVTLGAGASLTIASNVGHGEESAQNFTDLRIGTLSFGGASNAGVLKVNSWNTATVSSVTGTLSEVIVADNAASLTLGLDTNAVNAIGSISIGNGSAVYCSSTLNSFSGTVKGDGALHLKLNGAETGKTSTVTLADGSTLGHLYVDSGVFALNGGSDPITSNLHSTALHLANGTMFRLRNINNATQGSTISAVQTAYISGSVQLSIGSNVQGTTVISTNFLKDGSAQTAELKKADSGSITLSGQVELDTFTAANGNTTFTGNVNVGTFNANAGTSTLAGTAVIGALNGSGALVKDGEDELSITGGGTHSGSITVNAGTLKIGNAAALGASNTNSDRTITIKEGAELDINGIEGNTAAYAVTLEGGKLTNRGSAVGNSKRQVVTKLNLAADSSVEAAGDFGLIAHGYGATALNLGTYTLEKLGAGEFYITDATVSGTGTVKVSGGTLEFGNKDHSCTFSDAVTLMTTGGTMKLDINSANSFLLSGGKVSVSGGTFELGANAAAAGGDNFTANFELSGGETKLMTHNGSDGTIKNYDGTLTMTDGAKLTLHDGSAKFNGAISLNGTVNLTANWAKSGMEFAGAMTGTGTVYMRNNGYLEGRHSQKFTISGADNEFSGTIVVGQDSSGSKGELTELIVKNGTALQNAVVDLAAGNKAEMQLAAESITLAGLKGSNGSNVHKGSMEAATLTLNTAEGKDYTYSGGGLSGISLVKSGSGSQTMNGSAAYELGAVSVTGGALNMAANASATTLSITSGTLDVGEGKRFALTTATGDAGYSGVTGSGTFAVTLNSGGNGVNSKVTMGNAFTGALEVNGHLNSQSQLGGVSDVQFNNNAALVFAHTKDNLNGATLVNNTDNFSRHIKLTSGANFKVITWGADYNTHDNVISGNLSLINGNATLDKQDGGKLIISGSRLNSTGHELSIVNHSGEVTLDSVHFDGRVNLGKNGDNGNAINMTSGATAKDVTDAYSMVAWTDINMSKGNAAEKAVFDFSRSMIAILSGKTVHVGEGVQLKADSIKMSDRSNNGYIALDAGAELSATGTVKVQKITNSGVVTLSGSNKAVDNYSQRDSASLLHLGSNTTLETAIAENGTLEGSLQLDAGAHLTIKELERATTANLNNLVLADGAVLSGYTASAIDAAQEEGTINVAGTLTATGNAHVNANLTFSQGAKLDITGSDGVIMGSAVTFATGNKLQITGAASDTLAGFTLAGQHLTLFSGVDVFNVGDTAYNAADLVGTTTTITDFSSYIDLTDTKYNNVREHLVLKFDVPAGSQQGGAVYLWMETPEPATATLSLLALAALAARRRRH